MVVLDIDTKKSLFRPIEIKIDGELFKVRKITLGLLQTIQELQKGAELGSAEAIRRILEAVFDGPLALLMNLTIEQLNEVISVAVEKAYSAEVEEKNGQRSGQDKLQ